MQAYGDASKTQPSVVEIRVIPCVCQTDDEKLEFSYLNRNN